MLLSSDENLDRMLLKAFFLRDELSSLDISGELF